MTGTENTPSQTCRVCHKIYPLRSRFCTFCGAKSPDSPTPTPEEVVDAFARARPAPAVPPDDLAEELRRQREFPEYRDDLSGRSGGDVLTLDEGDLLSGPGPGNPEPTRDEE